MVTESERKNKGFGWADAIVTIVTLLILAAILRPMFLRSPGSARQEQCGSNIRSLGNSVKMFANDNGERFPKIWRWHPAKPGVKQWWFDQVAPYTRNTKILACPNDLSLKARPLSADSVAGRCTYVYRDYYSYTDADGHHWGGRIPGTSEMVHPDVSSIAYMRCSRGLLDQTGKVRTVDEAARFSYTNYAEAYRRNPILPTGLQPVITSEVLSRQAKENLLHGDGTNYLYVDGHVGWKSGEMIGASAKAQKEGKVGGIPDAF